MWQYLNGQLLNYNNDLDLLKIFKIGQSSYIKNSTTIE